MVAPGFKGRPVGLKNQCSQLFVSGACSFHSTEELGGFFVPLVAHLVVRFSPGVLPVTPSHIYVYVYIHMCVLCMYVSLHVYVYMFMCAFVHEHSRRSSQLRWDIIFNRW